MGGENKIIMRIIIRAKNLILDEKLKDYITEKIGGLEKFIKLCHSNEKWEAIKSACEFSVEVEKETQHHLKGLIFRAEVQVRLPGKKLKVETKADRVNAAIDDLREEFLNEVKKYKSRKISRDRRRQRAAKKNFHLASEARLFRKGRIREESL